ncbi:ParA family protein [Burkholderiaceae bacterium DAT-1]|nr:ParA family protein [Burkholderiaceae bacterium DAT-1]
MTCIAIFNQKGGVGKTTTAFNLAAAMNREHIQPLFIDLDPQAHFSQLLGQAATDSAESVYAYYRDHKPLRQIVRDVPGKGKLLSAHLELSKVDTQYGKGPDILNRLKMGLQRELFSGPDRTIIIDCSPMLGVLSLSAIFAADRVLIPVSADYLAVKGAMQVERTLNAMTRVLKQRVTRRYVLTRFDSRRKMSWSIEETLRAHFGSELCETHLTENVAVAESPYSGQNVFDYAPHSRGAHDHQALYEELKACGFLPGLPTLDEMTADLPAVVRTVRRVAQR